MLFNKKSEEGLIHEIPAKRTSPAVVAMTEPQTGARKQSGTPTRSVIDSWLTITGNLESEGEVQVDGEIHGNIRCTHLTIGRDATVEGNVTAEEVVVRGTVKGVIRANRVILQDSTFVDGTVYHKKLAIEEGARFEGRSARCDDPMTAELDGPATSELKAAAAEMRSGHKSSGGRGSDAEAAVA